MLWDRDENAVRRRWPRQTASPQLVQNAMRLSLASLYLCEDASGNLTDCVGSSPLTTAGSPVYRSAVGGKLGVSFDSATDGFNADVHDLAAASGLYAAVMHFTTTPDTFVFGRTNSASTEAALIAVSVPASGTLRFAIRDSGANDLTLAPAVDVRGKTCLLLAQIDRTNTTARFLIKPRGEASTTSNGSVAGFATVSGAAQTFGLCNFGGVTTQTGGFTCLFLAVATGAQTEGATVLDAIAARLHF